MCSNLRKAFIAVTLILSMGMFVACNSQVATKNSVDVSISNDSLVVRHNSNTPLRLQIKLNESITYSRDLQQNNALSIFELLKERKESLNDVAYILAINEGDVLMNLSLPNIIDTTFTYHVSLRKVSLYNTRVLSGTCAKLSGGFEASNVESSLIKWLYRKNIKNVSDTTVEKMRLYLQELKRTPFNSYQTNESIPVVPSLKGLTYRIASDLTADNYYLFACKSEKEIEDFVEEMVSIKFEGAVHSQNQALPCFRSQTTSGTTCIFLIGIDNDWNYRVVPVGLICIDNIKPSTLPGGGEEIHSIVLNKNKMKIAIPANAPTGRGYASLSTRNFGGNGVSCKVNFCVIFEGDVKSLTLIREGALTEWIGRGQKVIDLQKEDSPYYFTYELHLEDGDNYVPIVIKDLRGNTTEYKMNVPASFTRNSSPDINIENNIYN